MKNFKLAVIDNFEAYYNYMVKKIPSSTLLTPRFSIDFIKIYISPTHITNTKIFNIISTFSHTAEYKGKYSCNLTLSHNNHSCRVFIKRLFFKFKNNPNKVFIGTTIKLEHPTPQSIGIVEHFFGKKYKVSTIEYTMDLSSNDPIVLNDIYNICYLTASLKYARKFFKTNYQTNDEVNTIYLSDTRSKTTKAGRIYPKDINGKEVLRFEVIFKNKIFRSQKLPYSSMLSMANQHPSDVFKYITFKYLRPYHSKNFANENRQKLFEEKFFEHINGMDNCGGLSAIKEWFKIHPKLQKQMSNYLLTHSFAETFNKFSEGQTFI